MAQVSLMKKTRKTEIDIFHVINIVLDVTLNYENNDFPLSVDVYLCRVFQVLLYAPMVFVLNL